MAHQQIEVMGGPTRSGYMFWLPSDEYVGKSLQEYGEYSVSEWHVFNQFLTPESRVIEVGANIGGHTIPIAKRVSRVIAFEPQPFLCKLLKANLAVNDLRNVEVYQEAVGAEPGEVFFPNCNYNARSNYGAIGVADYVGMFGADKCLPVHMCVLDKFAITPDFIKIDVEGYEVEVLKGALHMLKSARPTLYIENDRPDRSKELLELLDSAGYDAWWHVAQMDNRQNFYGAENVFGELGSFNIVCIPRGRGDSIDGAPCTVESPEPPIGVPITMKYYFPTRVHGNHS